MPRFVDVDAARADPGLRLIVLPGVPSLWSEAAKALFHVKGVDYLAVRYRLKDDTVRNWTGVSNAPVAMYQNEPARSHWADILALAERLSSAPSLLPADAGPRAELLGLCHEICGEWGLMWCARLVLIHASLTSGGRMGFSLKLSQSLASKYGYAPDKIPEAHARARDILGALTAMLAGRRAVGSSYIIGNGLTALDIYVAAAAAVLAPFPEDLCPMIPDLRAALVCLGDHLDLSVPSLMREHRDFVYRQHLELPIQL